MMRSGGRIAVSWRPSRSAPPTIVSNAAFQRSMQPAGSTTHTPSPIASKVARQAASAARASRSALRARSSARTVASRTSGSTGWVR